VRAMPGVGHVFFRLSATHAAVPVAQARQTAGVVVDVLALERGQSAASSGAFVGVAHRARQGGANSHSGHQQAQGGEDVVRILRYPHALEGASLKLCEPFSEPDRCACHLDFRGAVGALESGAATHGSQAGRLARCCHRSNQIGGFLADARCCCCKAATLLVELLKRSLGLHQRCDPDGVLLGVPLSTADCCRCEPHEIRYARLCTVAAKRVRTLLNLLFPEVHLAPASQLHVRSATEVYSVYENHTAMQHDQAAASARLMRCLSHLLLLT
jgi:hypothetical protein